MIDAISRVANRYDVAGKHLDRNAMNELNIHFNDGLNRIRVAEIIYSKASTIVKEASAHLYEKQPELL